MSEGHLSSYLYPLLSQKSCLLKLYFLILEKQRELRDSNLFLKLIYVDFRHWLSTSQMRPVARGGDKDKIAGPCSDLHIWKHLGCKWWQEVVNYTQACHSPLSSEVKRRRFREFPNSLLAQYSSGEWWFAAWNHQAMQLVSHKFQRTAFLCKTMLLQHGDSSQFELESCGFWQEILSAIPLRKTSYHIFWSNVWNSSK